eukprot:CAMPEP_0205811434 /NCGR_PEP_ID=MMETSP0205-20121125/15623_1 /ASSEMBLY_ACC=CAM_ASM_000278 /TAXON_ID=36767 /ORGANISM="Euplotes focardii, Strain TN1" /LENGTH=107 /DNA_ID=CAMNT_0053090579 /DNA_START=249 /DNA_END=569 /DNA_ORIENTATION=+
MEKEGLNHESDDSDQEGEKYSLEKKMLTKKFPKEIKKNYILVANPNHALNAFESETKEMEDFDSRDARIKRTIENEAKACTKEYCDKDIKTRTKKGKLFSRIIKEDR